MALLALDTSEPCAGAECSHARCDKCWDLDATKCRRRHCGGGKCEGKIANQGPVSREWRPYEDLSGVPEVGGEIWEGLGMGSDVHGLGHVIISHEYGWACYIKYVHGVDISENGHDAPVFE
jgi:hypothetical protein